MKTRTIGAVLAVATLTLTLTACEPGLGSSNSAGNVFDFGQTEVNPDAKPSDTWAVELPESLTTAMGEDADQLLFTTAVVKSEPVESTEFCAVRVTPEYKDIKAATALLSAGQPTREEAEALASEGYDEYFEEQLLLQANNGVTDHWAPAAETQEELVAALEDGPSPQEDPIKYEEALKSFSYDSDDLEIQDRKLYVAASQACHAQTSDFGADVDGQHYDCGLQVTEADATTLLPDGSGYIPLSLQGRGDIRKGIVQLIGDEGVSEAFISTGLVPATWSEAIENFKQASRTDYIETAMNAWDNRGQDIYSQAAAKPGVVAAKMLGLNASNVNQLSSFDSSNPEKGTYLAEDYTEAVEVVPCALSAYDADGAATVGFNLVTGSAVTYDGSRWTEDKAYAPVAEVSLPTMQDGSMTVIGTLNGWVRDGNGNWVNRK